MEDLQTSEDLAFVGEDVENILLEVVNSVLSGKDYEAERVPHWTDQICEAAVKSLTDLNKPFKYTSECGLPCPRFTSIASFVCCLSPTF